jgi:hypothetical protein
MDFLGANKRMKNTPFSLQYYFGVVIKLWGWPVELFLSFSNIFVFFKLSKKSFFGAFIKINLLIIFKIKKKIKF